MASPAQKLLDSMQAYWDSLSPWNEPELAVAFADQLATVDPIALVVELFHRHQDSRLFTWMCELSPAWRDLPLEGWCRIIHEIAPDPNMTYQAVVFFGEVCALDVVALVESDRGIDEEARLRVRRQFPGGGMALGGAGVRELLSDYGIDYEAIRRRLADEGAPMTSRE